MLCQHGQSRKTDEGLPRRLDQWCTDTARRIVICANADSGDMGSFGIVKKRFEISSKSKGRHDHWIPSSKQNIIL